MKKTVAIVGMGRVGTSIGLALNRAGYEIVGLSSKRKKDSLLFDICNNFSSNPEDITPLADIVFLSVPDDVIENLCKEIAQKKGFRCGSLVIHTSGALGSCILESAEGCRHLSLHPIKIFTPLPSSFEGTYFSVEGNDLDAGIHLVKDIGGIPFVIKRQDKLIYHTALSFSSSLLSGLLSLEMSLLKKANVDEKFATILAKDTIRRIEEEGIKNSFSGPVKRIDKKIIQEAMKTLGRLSDQALDAYRILARITVLAEKEQGVIKKEDAETLLKIL